METFPYKLTVINLLNLVLEEILLAKQTKKDKSEISMKMKIILIAIIASCYSAPQYPCHRTEGIIFVFIFIFPQTYFQVPEKKANVLAVDVMEM